MECVGMIIHLTAFFLCVTSVKATKSKYYSDENDVRILMGKMMAMEKQIQQLEVSEKETKHILRQCEVTAQREIIYLKKKTDQKEKEIQELIKIMSIRSNQKEIYSYKRATDTELITAAGFIEPSIIRLNAEKSHIYRFLELPTGPVAFSAYLAQSISELGLKQRIKYGGVLTNEGNAYNPNTGIFTCPSSGLYLISFFTSIHGISGTWVRLVVDDINVSDAVSRGFDPNGDDQGGNVAILRLTTGQSVWTEVQLLTNANLSSTTEFRHVTFSGVRLSD
ncbi:hypothetical protein ACJMK2_000720 [Sinanodonta woodiana]|uniref:C1q domain-containing protein n=1 Tax=Sinanodonta woodiana TaxID=1069815 RepID=A0ABD3XQB1_SINWO